MEETVSAAMEEDATLVAALIRGFAGDWLRGARRFAAIFHQALARADLVITGEGSLDGQSAFGKTPAGIARLARAYNVPVIALGGRVTREAEMLRDLGVTALFSICPGPLTLDEARASATENLRFTARQLAALWGAARG